MKDIKTKLLTDILLKRYYDVLYNTSNIEEKQVIKGTSYTLTNKDNLPVIIPDFMYKPKVKVCIDFNHEYTFISDEKLVTQLGLSAGKQRVISLVTLQDICKKLVKFNSVFFDYTNLYTHKKSGNNTTLKTILEKIDNSPVFINHFLNYFINKFITNIETSRMVNNVGTAIVSLREATLSNGITRNSLFFDQMLTYQYQLLNPYLPISIWSSGRIHPNYMFPIFSGFIFQVNPKNAKGFKTLDIHCSDMLKYLQYSSEIVNPALVQLMEIKKNESFSIFSKPFYGVDHMEIFTKLFLGGNVTYGTNLQELNTQQKAIQDSKEGTIKLDSIGFDFINNTDTDGSIAEFDKRTVVKIDKSNTDVLSKLLTLTSYNSYIRSLNYWGGSVTPYRIFGQASPRVFSSEFSSRFDILQESAAKVYYNFYVDCSGNICYHPNRFANKFLKYKYPKTNNYEDVPHTFVGTQIITKEEIFDNSDVINVDEIVTFLIVKGQGEIETLSNSELYNIFGHAVDKKNYARYGYKRFEVQDDLLNINPTIQDSSSSANSKKFKLADFIAKEFLMYENAKAFTKSINMVFRPELELALPVYFKDTNDVFYVQSITHSINVNDVATTSITCNFGRKFEEIPPDIYSYTMLTENLYKTKNDMSLTFGDLPASAQSELENYYVPYTANNALHEQQSINLEEWGIIIENEEKKRQIKSKIKRAYNKRKAQENTIRAAQFKKEKENEEKFNPYKSETSDLDKVIQGDIEKL